MIAGITIAGFRVRVWGLGGTLQEDRAGNREDRVRRDVQLLRRVRWPRQDTLV